VLNDVSDFRMLFNGGLQRTVDRRLGFPFANLTPPVEERVAAGRSPDSRTAWISAPIADVIGRTSRTAPVASQ